MYIGLVDDEFVHHNLPFSNPFVSPNVPFNWDRSLNHSEVTVFTDMNVMKSRYFADRGIKTHIAWLLESIEMVDGYYRYVDLNPCVYDHIFTHERTWLEEKKNAIFIPFGGCWIYPTSQGVHFKSKNISLVASTKRNTIGQALRHDLAIFPGIDLYGRQYKEVENKIEALKDYRYSIVIENIKRDYWFTEKLIDAFVTGTVPVYWGCPSIGDFFNTDGMVIIDSVADFKNELPKLDGMRYKEMKSAIEENFHKAREYMVPENHIYRELVKLGVKDNGL